MTTTAALPLSFRFFLLRPSTCSQNDPMLLFSNLRLGKKYPLSVECVEMGLTGTLKGGRGSAQYLPLFASSLQWLKWANGPSEAQGHAGRERDAGNFFTAHINEANRLVPWQQRNSFSRHFEAILLAARACVGERARRENFRGQFSGGKRENCFIPPQT